MFMERYYILKMHARGALEGSNGKEKRINLSKIRVRNKEKSM